MLSYFVDNKIIFYIDPNIVKLCFCFVWVSESYPFHLKGGELTVYLFVQSYTTNSIQSFDE